MPAESGRATILLAEIKSVEAKDRLPTGKPRWTRWDLVDGNGTRYATFDSGVGRFLEDHKGQVVDIEFADDGRGLKVRTAQLHVERTVAAGVESRPGIRVREGCLQAAVSAHGPFLRKMAENAPTHDLTEGNIRGILLTAAKFEAWVRAGEDESEGPEQLPF